MYLPKIADIVSFSGKKSKQLTYRLGKSRAVSCPMYFDCGKKKIFCHKVCPKTCELVLIFCLLDIGRN